MTLRDHKILPIKCLLALFGMAILLGVQPACQPKSAPTNVVGNTQPADTGNSAQNAKVATFMPERRPFRETYMRQLKLPPGFQINVFARGLGNPRMMAVSPNGTVYVTQPDLGRVTALRDNDGDGMADTERTVVSGLSGVHGIALHQGKLYLATPTTVYESTVDEQGQLTRPQVRLANLPPGRQHPNRTLAFGPDGRLYVSVGSSCNACIENHPEYATILVANPTTWQRSRYAGGLRNTIGFGWHPATQVMWGMDHGTDWLGPDIPPEELNRLASGRDYGWPFCYGRQQVDRNMARHLSDVDPETYCTTKTTPAVLTYQAHSSPIGMVFYTGIQFPPAYRGDAFVAFRGSWNRKPAVGYKVVRIRFENGTPVGFEDFVTGFLIENGTAQFARLAGIAMAPDGALLVADDQNGMIYRIAYQSS